FALAQVAIHTLAIKSLKRAQVGSCPDQDAHAVAAREQRARHVASHKPVAAGDQRRPVRHRDFTHPAAARAPTAAAAARPAITALSMVAGRPVWIQSPAIKKFLSGVSTGGRS